jgi:cytochrome P450
VSATTQQAKTSSSTAAAEQWSVRVEPSAAGPAPQDGSPIALPPAVRLPRALQQLRFSMRQSSFFLRSSQRLGQTFRMRGVLEDDWVTVTSHPDHVRSLFTADPELAPSLTGESPLRPIVGPNSVLTLLGPKHMRQRKLLLPPFHGEAIERYTQMIEDAAQREIDSWPIGQPFALGRQMQAVTLEVIMSGIFGVQGLPPKGTLERELRDEIHSIVSLSTRPFAILAEMVLLSRQNPGKVVSGVMQRVDELLYALIAERREAAGADDGRTDILSLLLAASDEEGVQLSDEELRDELITLVLAGHETTANSLAWAFERLLRNPAAYDRLRALVRAGGADARRGRRICGGCDPRDNACAARGPLDRAAGERALAARPLQGAGRYPGGDEHHAAAPPRGRLPAAFRVRSRALPGCQARHLHLDPVRRRHQALSWRHTCDGRAARRAARDCGPHGHACARSGPRETAPSQRHDGAVWRDAGRARSPPFSVTGLCGLGNFKIGS